VTARSFDLQRMCPRPEKMGVSEYNIKISRLMTAVNGVHIVFIFKEGEGEHNVNQSASIELDHLLAGKQRHVMVFFEEGSFEQSRSLFKGLLELNVIDWAINSFTRHRNIDVTTVSPALLSAGLMFYHNRLSDPEIGYTSKDDLKMALDTLWIQSLMHRDESGNI
jgi:hypothetical protein